MNGCFFFFLVSLMTTKTPSKLKMSPKSRFGEVMLCNRKDVEGHQECDPDSPSSFDEDFDF